MLTIERTHMATGQDWAALAQSVLAGEAVSREQALAMLQSSDDELLSLLGAAFEIRRAHFGKTVQLYYLQNVKSGLCPEDCGYCSQSKVSNAPIPKYPMLKKDEILAGAQRAAENKANTFCIVASGRGPTERELEQVIDAVTEIKQQFGLRVCCCLGILKPGQAERLKAVGVDHYNHNLNTSEAFHAEVCSTHTFQDRARTVGEVREAGISTCSGGIIGMGESDADVVALAFSLRELEVHSIPVNFYIPIEGTPFAGKWHLTPRYCLKTLSMFRFVNPSSEIRIAGGRELHLGPLQPLGLYPANSIFVSDYLTTKGQAAEDDFRMIEALGFQIGPPPAAAQNG